MAMLSVLGLASIGRAKAGRSSGLLFLWAEHRRPPEKQMLNRHTEWYMLSIIQPVIIIRYGLVIITTKLYIDFGSDLSFDPVIIPVSLSSPNQVALPRLLMLVAHP